MRETPVSRVTVVSLFLSVLAGTAPDDTALLVSDLSCRGLVGV